jgi:hypothetical protein
MGNAQKQGLLPQDASNFLQFDLPKFALVAQLGIF